MVSKSSLGSATPKASLTALDRRVAGDALAAVGQPEDVALAVLVSNSSSISPTICSSTSSIVISPAVAAEFVDDDGQVVAVAAELAQQLVQALDSGTKTAGRSSVRRFSSGARCSLSRSLAIRMPMMLSRSPS